MVLQLDCSLANKNNNVQICQSVFLMPERFPNNALDSISLNRRSNILFGDHGSQARVTMFLLQGKNEKVSVGNFELVAVEYSSVLCCIQQPRILGVAVF